MVEIVVDTAKCWKCIGCVNICSRDVLNFNEDNEIIIENIDDCTLCETCMDVCPSEAIKVKG